MKINDIQPRFENIEDRLKKLESTMHTHEDEMPDVDPVEVESEETQVVEEVLQEEESDPPVEEAPEIVQAEPDPLEEDLEEETQEAVDIDVSRFHKETASDATPNPVDPLDSDLKRAIAKDVKPYKVAEVINAAMNHPKLRNARESVMKPETGQMEKVQAFRLTDGTFMVPSRDVFQRLVLETKIDEVEWVKDVTDCEDISLRFNARCIELGLNSCGRVMSWSGGHCFIIAIVRDGDSLGFAFLEPQTDQFLTDEVGEGQYSLDNCLILIN